MKQKNRKLIAPVVITLLVVLYYIFYFGVLITMLDGAVKYLLGIIPLVLSVVMVKVCLERIDEIKKGEEDDLSQY